MEFQLRNLEESNKYRRNDGIRKSAFSNYHVDSTWIRVVIIDSGKNN